MSHYSAKNSISDQETATNGTSNAGNCCSKASSELKLYQAFIFSVPIFFTFVLLLLFYLFYLRRRRVDWGSLRMRTARSMPSSGTTDEISRCELGLNKELREMLPIIIFKESFYVKDTQCSVCLGDFEAGERLQQIPGCGHTFHMECIDLWLSTHTTCPLCRRSLITFTKQPRSSDELVVIIPTHVGVGNGDTSSLPQIGDNEAFVRNASLSNGGDPQTSLHNSASESTITDERVAASRDQDIHLNQHGTDMGNKNAIKSET